jgi:hypothetical protein
VILRAHLLVHLVKCTLRGIVSPTSDMLDRSVGVKMAIRQSPLAGIDTNSVVSDRLSEAGFSPKCVESRVCVRCRTDAKGAP